jgi:hypothetical protein
MYDGIMQLRVVPTHRSPRSPSGASQSPFGCAPSGVSKHIPPSLLYRPTLFH